LVHIRYATANKLKLNVRHLDHRSWAERWRAFRRRPGQLRACARMARAPTLWSVSACAARRYSVHARARAVRLWQVLVAACGSKP